MNKKKWTSLIIAMSLSACATNQSETNVKVYEADISTAHYTEDAEEFLQSEDYTQWVTSYYEAVEETSDIDLSAYYNNIIHEFLDDTSENTVVSPFNIYLALSMLAQVTDNETRSQILDVIQQSSIEDIQNTVESLWNATYVDTPILQQKTGASLWVDDSASYHEDIVSLLTDIYKASIYYGDLQDSQMSEALKEWTNEQTGNLLTEYTDQMGFSDGAVFDLITTLYYKAAWLNSFEETDPQTFHGTNGDTDVVMLNQSDTNGYYYTTDRYTLIQIPLKYSGNFVIVLPKNNTLENLLPTLDYEQIMTELDTVMQSQNMNLTIPEFDVSNQLDLNQTLENMGITDVFDEAKADFSPLTDDSVVLSSVVHGARVMVDQDGITGAAYTEMMVSATAFFPDEPMEITVDRPFLFMITSASDDILFTGVIQNME